MPEAETFQLPMKILKGPDAGAHMMPHYYMPPHVLVPYLHEVFPVDLGHTILGTKSALSEFWAGVPSSDPRLKQLVKDHSDYKKWCAPLVIHGDGVP